MNCGRRKERLTLSKRSIKYLDFQTVQIQTKWTSLFSISVTVSLKSGNHKTNRVGLRVRPMAQCVQDVVDPHTTKERDAQLPMCSAAKLPDFSVF